MNCDEALEMISAALDGELSPSERNALDEHLASCPACAALYAELAGHSRLLRELDCEMPADLTGRILSRLPEQRPAPAKQGRVPQWRRWSALAACLVLLLWVGLTLPDWRTGPASQTADPVSEGFIARSAPQSDAEEMPASGSAVPQNEPASYAIDDPAENDFSKNNPAPASVGPAIGTVQYLRIDWAKDIAPGARLLTSAEDLSECLSQFGLSGSAAVLEADYFETGVLIAVTLTEGSGSVSHMVETVRPCGGGYEIVVRRQVPEAGTCDMAAWLLLIETDGSVTPADTLTVVLTD